MAKKRCFGCRSHLKRSRAHTCTCRHQELAPDGGSCFIPATLGGCSSNPRPGPPAIRRRQWLHWGPGRSCSSGCLSCRKQGGAEVCGGGVACVWGGGATEQNWPLASTVRSRCPLQNIPRGRPSRWLEAGCRSRCLHATEAPVLEWRWTVWPVQHPALRCAIFAGIANQL